jgi:hypothetical protein
VYLHLHDSGRILAGGGSPDLQEVSARYAGWGSPPGNQSYDATASPLGDPMRTNQIGDDVSCKQRSCTRTARSRGWCTTHYRRWRSGENMSAPVRSYVQYEQDAEGKCVPTSAKPQKVKRERPFAAEYALLSELGLDDSAR